jgi:4-aminobutyrate aminotransferase-like enzyme
MFRVTGDTIAFSPPLIIEESHIAQGMDIVRDVLGSL